MISSPSRRFTEIAVGVFLLLALFALLVLAFRVSGLTRLGRAPGYRVTAAFDDIGQLRVKAPVKIDGVSVGEVENIHLDQATFRAIVTLRILSAFDRIPDDSSAAILTAGLLGDNYIALTPRYSQTFLKTGSQIEETYSAMILEKLIGQFLFRAGEKTDSSSKSGNTIQSEKPHSTQKTLSQEVI